MGDEFPESQHAKHYVVIYGGAGALGANCVSRFKSEEWWVASIDFKSNAKADVNILVNTTDTLPEQEEKILNTLDVALNGLKLSSVICVAGGWKGGNAKKDLVQSADLMLRKNVWSSVIAASIATHYLKESGLLVLSGANCALLPTPNMIAYGVAKAAVHNLTKSLAEKHSGLSMNSVCVSILPVILDTPMNRGWMPDADYSTWTPLEFVSELLWKWSVDGERPENGSLIGLLTKNYETELIVR